MSFYVIDLFGDSDSIFVTTKTIEEEKKEITIERKKINQVQLDIIPISIEKSKH